MGVVRTFSDGATRKPDPSRGADFDPLITVSAGADRFEGYPRNEDGSIDWNRTISELGPEAVPPGVAFQLLRAQGVEVGAPSGAPPAQGGARAVGKALEADCLWCRYGKPAAAGAALAAVGAFLMGQEPMRGALYGAGLGAAYGWWRG